MKQLQRILLTVMMLTLFVGVAAAQNTREGIVLKAQKAKTAIYEIKVTGMNQAAHAEMLDAQFRSKKGVLSSSTDLSTRICTVEVQQALTPDLLRQVVRSVGLDVAKSFDE